MVEIRLTDEQKDEYYCNWLKTILSKEKELGDIKVLMIEIVEIIREIEDD